MHTYLFTYAHMYIDTYMAACQKHRMCNRPGRPFCDKACNRIGGTCDKPPCDKPIEDYSTLHRGPRQGFVTEGPGQTPILRHCHMCIYTYVDGWIDRQIDG